ncbi:acyltransferase family protein [Asticcacaulis solisilvae]|uniref:acyltransferase family protein n=1 Tax=Asticcacaulis solisilvae TaxID=1217274 RepID=UPI003FD82E7A
MASATKHRFEALDAFRGFFAVVIVLYHFSTYGYFYDLPLVRNASYGVDFFFVLSGFVITSAYLDKVRQNPDFPEFVVRRFGRIWPLHIVMLALLVGLEFAKLLTLRFAHLNSGQPPFSGANDIPSLIAGVFMLNGVGFFKDFTWNIPSWSISAEFYTYLIFYFCAARDKIYAWVAIAVVAASGAAMVWFGLPPHKLRIIEGYGFISCIFDFMVGSLAFLAFRKGLVARSNTTAEVLAVTMLFSMFFLSIPLQAVVAPLAFAIVILVFSRQSGAISKMAMMRFPQYLGKTSYSIYLLHFVLIEFVMSGLRVISGKFHVPIFKLAGDTTVIWFGPRLLMDGVALIFVAIVILLSGVTYRVIEESARKNFYKFDVKKLWDKGGHRRPATHIE